MTPAINAQKPKRRFVGFSDAWLPTPLSKLFSSLDAGVSVNSGDRQASPGEKGILKTSCVSDGVFNPSENKVVWESHEIDRLQQPVEADTIIISRMNTPALVGANALVTKDWDNLYLPDRLWAGKVNGTTSPYWLGLRMADQRTRQKLSDLASGTSGTMKNISKGDVLALTLPTPTLPEQQKIAAFLGAIDARIGLLRRRRAALERYKKGMMQRLFALTLRFKRDDGAGFPDWVEKRLGQVGEINPKSGPLPQEFEYIDLESVTNGQLSETQTILRDDAPERAQRLVKDCDILFQTVRPYQKNNLFFEHGDNYVASTGYAQIRAKINAKFLFQLLLTRPFVANVIKRCTGTSYPAINSSDLAAIPVSVPHLDEQRKIADFLSALDDKISAVSAKIDAMQTFKKGLLQQMFV